MRLIAVVTVACLAACASENLEQAPPVGVDFSGHWTLNQADSDDPQRLMQAQFNHPANHSGASSGGSGGHGGQQGNGHGGSGAMMAGGPEGPVMPSVGAMSEGLRWPGKQLEIKQVAGVIAFTSDGINRVCQPMDAGKPQRHHGADGDDHPSGRDPRDRGRDIPPPRCGWTDKTLIVHGGDPDDDHPGYEEHYSLSEDKQRLVEVVGFGGHSSGFTMSRVWDRSSQ
jgi:hypothetical protein